jgi:DNA-binding MarR family transcriptional regulator
MQREMARQWWDELERLARVLERVGPDEVCCEGLSQRQTAILRTLVEREGARLSDLAAAAKISPSAMTRNLERLEAAGLVERVRGQGADAREAMVRITDEGRKVRGALDGAMLERATALAQSIPPTMRDQVLESLKLLNEAFAQAGCCALNEPLVKIRSKP